MAQEPRTQGREAHPTNRRPGARPRKDVPPFRLRLAPPDADDAPAYVGDPLMGWVSAEDEEERENSRE